MTLKATKNASDLSAAQKKLIAESLCSVATNLASSGRPIEGVIEAVRVALTSEIQKLNAPPTPSV